MTETSDWKHYSYTAGQLMKKLAQFPEDTPVIMASDAEGNNHLPLSWVGAANYLPERTWSGEIVDIEGEREYLGDVVPVVLLIPVN